MSLSSAVSSDNVPAVTNNTTETISMAGITTNNNEAVVWKQKQQLYPVRNVKNNRSPISHHRQLRRQRIGNNRRRNRSIDTAVASSLLFPFEQLNLRPNNPIVTNVSTTANCNNTRPPQPITNIPQPFELNSGSSTKTTTNQPLIQTTSSSHGIHNNDNNKRQLFSEPVLGSNNNLVSGTTTTTKSDTVGIHIPDVICHNYNNFFHPTDHIANNDRSWNSTTSNNLLLPVLPNTTIKMNQYRGINRRRPIHRTRRRPIRSQPTKSCSTSRITSISPQFADSTTGSITCTTIVPQRNPGGTNDDNFVRLLGNSTHYNDTTANNSFSMTRTLGTTTTTATVATTNDTSAGERFFNPLVKTELLSPQATKTTKNNVLDLNRQHQQKSPHTTFEATIVCSGITTMMNTTNCYNNMKKPPPIMFDRTKDENKDCKPSGGGILVTDSKGVVPLSKSITVSSFSSTKQTSGPIVGTTTSSTAKGAADVGTGISISKTTDIPFFTFGGDGVAQSHGSMKTTTMTTNGIPAFYNTFNHLANIPSSYQPQPLFALIPPPSMLPYSNSNNIATVPAATAAVATTKGTVNAVVPGNATNNNDNNKTAKNTITPTATTAVKIDSEKTDTTIVSNGIPKAAPEIMSKRKVYRIQQTKTNTTKIPPSDSNQKQTARPATTEHEQSGFYYVQQYDWKTIGSKADSTKALQPNLWYWERDRSDRVKYDAEKFLTGTYFVTYSKDVSFVIEHFYQQYKQRKIVHPAVTLCFNIEKKTETTYEFDFHTMIRTNVHSKNKRRIRRNTEQLIVSKGSTEYNTVESCFFESMGNNRSSLAIVKMERIDNRSLFDTYATKLETMKERDSEHPHHRINNRNINRSQQRSSGIQTATGLEIERRWLFHGTKKDAIPKIIKQGLNRSFAGQNACSYGRGVYFARDAHYSCHERYAVPDSDGIQHVFLCRVAVGDWCLGTNNHVTPDCKPHDDREVFDTTVDNVTNPQIFVVYHDCQAYPEYLISFRKNSACRNR